MGSTRTSVDLARVTVRVHRRLVAEEDNDGRETAHEGAPPLVGEDVAEEGTATTEVRAVSRDGRGHGVVATNTDTEDDTPYTEPDERTSWREITCEVNEYTCAFSK